MPTAEFAIDLHHVEKRYRGSIYALRGIDIQVRRGEIFGLLGPNGAGKSTLVKIMMTVIRPTRAMGTVLDRPIGDKATLARVGYLPENHRFPRHLTGRQILDLFGGLSGMPKSQRRRRAEELLAEVGMTEAADRKVATYSKGMMQRIGLAQALMNNPDLIVLDEPTDGVDPIGRLKIRGVLEALRSRGTTVFINSHLLSELEQLCDRVAILLGGTVAAQGSLDDLSAARVRYEIELNEFSPTIQSLACLSVAWMPPPIRQPTPHVGGEAAATPSLPPPLRGTLPDGTWIELHGQALRIGTTDPTAIQPVIDQLRSAGLVLRRLQVVRPTLEELFIEAVDRHQSSAPAMS